MKKSALDMAFGDTAPSLGATPAPSPELVREIVEDGFTVELPPLPARRRARGRRRIDFYVDYDLKEGRGGYNELLRKAEVQFDCTKGEFQDALLRVALGQPAEIARTLREMLFETEEDE